jgi:hypothetical protein
MRRYSRDAGRVMSALASTLRFNASTLWADLTPDEVAAFLRGLQRCAAVSAWLRRCARHRPVTKSAAPPGSCARGRRILEDLHPLRIVPLGSAARGAPHTGIER